MTTSDISSPPAEAATKPEAVVVGASAGALAALTEIFAPLPQDYPLPVMVVVHVPRDKPSLMPNLIGDKCLLKVCEAEDKEPIRPGTVYFAPPDYHLLIERDGRLSLSSEEEVQYSRPSIDVLFESAADAYGPRLVGVILTGANDDGARGLKAIMDAGGSGVVLRPDQAFAQAMPLAALKACPAARALGLAEIAVYLQEVVAN